MLSPDPSGLQPQGVVLLNIPLHQTPSRLHTLHHGEDEWESMRSHIREIYLKENRTLKELIPQMEARFGFKATVRMYKRHFETWNIRKYNPRESAKQRERKNAKRNIRPSTSRQTTGRATPLAPQLRDIPYQRRTLSVFYNISKFNEAKLESIMTLFAGVPRSSLEFTPLHTFQPVDSGEVYGLFTFSSALYHRNRGHLAGKAIRKAFIVVERAMQNLNIHFIWNFVDIMYGMILRGQLDLLRIFLNHSAALSNRLLPTQHPVAEALRQLAESSESDKEAIIGQAWRCNYDTLQRWLDPWCEVVDDLTWTGSESFEDSKAENDHSSNFLIVKGLASYILDREEASGHDHAKSQAPSDPAAEREFRQLRIKYNTVMDVIDMLGPAQLPKDEMFVEPSASDVKIPTKADGLALKGRVYQHLANRQIDEARIYNEQVRKVAADFASTEAYSKLKYLQHLCAVEDKLLMVGSTDYAHEIGADVLLLTEDFLRDIPDNGA